MKKRCLFTALTAIVIMAAGWGISGEASVEKGKQLFNDPSLGGSTNSASCASCHPGGQRLEKAGTGDSLAEMINTCIERPLKGRALAADSPEMKSLKMYIKSLGK